MAELPLGSRIEDFELLEIVGRGGMGVVYKARQLSLDRTVALKAIAPELTGDENFRERFKGESRIAASIDHPNVIPVYLAGESDGVLYLTMRYVDGVDLRAVIDGEGPLEPARAARIVAQVAAALAAAHERGLVHRDVKPGNVLIDQRAELEHVYLTDFGIARHLDATSGLTKTGAVVGTLDYLAPEQIEGRRADARSDLYSLGCVLFETLTGSVPFPRDNEAAKMFAHVNVAVPSALEARPKIPQELDDAVARTMAKEPDARFQSATELAALLLGHAQGTGSGLPLPASTEPSPLPTEAAQATEEAGPSADTKTTQVVGAEPRAGGPVVPPRRGAVVSARRSRRALALAGAVAVVLAALVVLVTRSGGEGEDGLDPRALPPVRLGSGNAGLAAGAGSVWVADRRENVVRRVDPESRRVVNTIRVGAEPRGVAVGAGAVWVTNAGDDSVSRIDPRTRRVTTASVGDFPVGIAVSGRAVWTADERGGTATRLDPRTGRARTGQVGRAPVQVAVAGATAWVTAEGDDTVVPLDAATAAPDGAPVRVGGAPRGITFAGGALWVAASEAGAVVVIDPVSRRVTDRISVGANPRQVGGGEGAVWVTSAGAGRVVAIDPRSRKVVARVRVEGAPHGLAVGEGRVWASNLEGGLLTAIEPRGG